MKYWPDIVVLYKVGGIYANSTYPVDFLIDNLKIQNNVIESAATMCGTCCFLAAVVSILSMPQPIVEDILDGCLEPTNQSYAIAKITGIQLCKPLQPISIDALCLMPTNLYGPGDNYDPSSSHVFASMIRRFIHAMQRNRNLLLAGVTVTIERILHVDDHSATIHCLTHRIEVRQTPKTLDGHYTPRVGTGVDISLFELTQLISDRVGYSGKILWDTSYPDGTPKKQLNISRYRN